MINVTNTYIPDKQKYQQYVERIFESGWLTNNGELVQLLEKRLSEYLGVPYLVLTANGTLALQVAMKLLQVEGEVITTPFSFVATASSLVWEGLKPRFADIDPATFNLDPENVEALITPQTSAILPVHVYGNLCDDAAISAVARAHGLKVIYDAAHAFGVKKEGRSACSMGDISALSFHSTKLFHTIEGGAIVLPDVELYKKAKLYINFGIAGPEQITSLGINAKMNEFEAAMGLCVLDDMDLILEGRRRVSQTYMDELSSLPGFSFQEMMPGMAYNYSYFPLLCPDEDTLLGIKNKLEEANIFPRRYFYPSLSNLPYVETPDPTPLAGDISKRVLCLPLYFNLEEKDQQRIITLIKSNLQ